ncbi:TIGR02234 family membrane protein [Kitasatospora sp. NPDC052896]|uniref:TIGR02234 family membrane protein n=1 Tax=Kitasatospora sp. NPDC052896 TaxID=3364061 RepID=UPI0037C5725C
MTDSPPPHSADPSAAPSSSRRSLGLMLLLIALGAVLVLTAGGRVWAQGQVSGHLSVTATGSEISGLPGALALVALASAVAVFAVRGFGRLLVGVLVTLAGIGATVGAALGARNTNALDETAAQKLALVGTTASQVTHTAWPWVAAVGGVLLAAAGLVTVVCGRAWPGMGARYDAPTTGPARPAAAAGLRETPADLWKALDRGEDPTTS